MYLIRSAKGFELVCRVPDSVSESLRVVCRVPHSARETLRLVCRVPDSVSESLRVVCRVPDSVSESPSSGLRNSVSESNFEWFVVYLIR